MERRLNDSDWPQKQPPEAAVMQPPGSPRRPPRPESADKDSLIKHLETEVEQQVN